MKSFLAASAIILAATSAGWSQTANGMCGDVVKDASATCPAVLDPGAGGTVNSGRGGSGTAIDTTASQVGTPGSAVDSNTTNTIPAVPTPNGMTPLDVRNDPLNGSNQAPVGSGNATGNNNPGVPFSNQGVSSGSSGISSPSIK